MLHNGFVYGAYPEGYALYTVLAVVVFQIPDFLNSWSLLFVI